MAQAAGKSLNFAPPPPAARLPYRKLAESRYSSSVDGGSDSSSRSREGASRGMLLSKRSGSSPALAMPEHLAYTERRGSLNPDSLKVSNKNT